MLQYWPLRAPPQIAGDSTILALTSSYQAFSLPNRADGNPAPYVLLSWEGGEPLQIKTPGNSLGLWLHEVGMPYLFSVEGEQTAYQAQLGAGTGFLRVTPVEGD